MKYLAVIYAWTGDEDRAIEQIAAVERVPHYLSYAFSSSILIGTRSAAICSLAPKETGK